MDDFFKRLLVSYLGLTATFWALAYAMTENGFARPRNPAWQLISMLNHFFTWGLLLGLGIFAFAVIAANMEHARKEREKLEQKKRDEEVWAQNRAASRIENDKREEERKIQMQKEKEERERREEEWRKSEEFKRRTRTPEEAAREAFKSFL